MRIRKAYKRTALALLLVTLLGFTLSSAYADETSALKEKLAQLEATVDDLESLVKSLTLQVQRVSENVVSDLENFRPRLFAAERVAKDNTFELKKLSGTVAQLADQVAVLSELPEKVKYLKESVAELNARLDASIEALSNRIQTNELSISKLQESVDNALIVVQTFQENLGTIFGQLDVAQSEREQLRGFIAGLQTGLEGLASQLDSNTRGLQASLEGLSARLDSQIGSLSARLEDLEAQIAEVKDQLDQVESLANTTAQLQAKFAEMEARIEGLQARTAQIQDALQQMREMRPRIQQLAEQLQELNAQIQVNARQITEAGKMTEENAAQIAAIRAELQELRQALQAMKEKPEKPDIAPQLQKRVERLEAKLAEIVMELESNRQAVQSLQESLQSLEGLKEEIRAEVLAAIPRAPSPEEIRLQVEETATAIATQQAKEAKARADAAQGLAIVALLAGIAGIAVAFLF